MQAISTPPFPLIESSGKDYTVHSALNIFVGNEGYHVKKAFVLSNAREIRTKGRITYLPVYDVMFFGTEESPGALF